MCRPPLHYRARRIESTVRDAHSIRQIMMIKIINIIVRNNDVCTGQRRCETNGSTSSDPDIGDKKGLVSKRLGAPEVWTMKRHKGQRRRYLSTTEEKSSKSSTQTQVRVAR